MYTTALSTQYNMYIQAFQLTMVVVSHLEETLCTDHSCIKFDNLTNQIRITLQYSEVCNYFSLFLSHH